MKKIIIGAGIALGVSLLLFMLCFFTTTKRDLRDYSARITNSHYNLKLFPTLDTLPDYQDIYYMYRYERVLFFSSDSILLAITYDKDTYETEKERLNQFLFLTEPVYGFNEDYY